MQIILFYRIFFKYVLKFQISDKKSVYIFNCCLALLKTTAFIVSKTVLILTCIIRLLYRFVVHKKLIVTTTKISSNGSHPFFLSLLLRLYFN